MHLGRWMKGGGEWSIHYLKIWSGEPLPPKEIGFLFRKVLEWELENGGHESAGQRGKSLGGVTWVKSRKWGFQQIPRKNVALLFQILSLIPGEGSLSASLRGCCFFPLLSHLCFFPTCFRISLHPSRPQTVEFGCALGRLCSAISPVVSCWRFSAKAEPFAPASD